MNGLFVGPYKQNDGWGLASVNYIKAIATQIPNLSIKPIYYTGQTNKTEPSIAKYENTSFDTYDVVFQKALPHNIVISKKIKKNVGLFVLETNNISHSTCIPILNKLDEICVPSRQEEKCLKTSGVISKIKVVSQPLDIDFIDQNRSHTLSFVNQSVANNSFKFYTIGEFSERKNLYDLILAFNLAFDKMDNVELYIKTSKPDLSGPQARNHIEQQIIQFKQKFNIKSAKKEIIITDRMSDKDIVGLHNTCHCYVSTSLGEAFCRPAAEALVLGKTPIVTNHTGMIDFVNKENGYIVESTKTPVLVENIPVRDQGFDLYSVNEHWYRPKIYSLIDNMRKVYQAYKKDRKNYETKCALGQTDTAKEQFRYETVGKKICDPTA